MAKIREKNIYLSVGAVFLLVTLLHYMGITESVEQGIRNISTPVLGSVYGISVKMGDNYQFFKNRSEFISAYEKMLVEKEKVDTLTADVKRFSDENSELRRQLHYFQNTSLTNVLANVVGKELVSTEQTIIIDRGSADGIQESDPVISGSGILVGKIFKTEKSISYVRLLNDNVSRVGATVQNQDKSLGVIEGGFGISLRMNLIPRDEVILVNDQIITSGLEQKMPRGILIGSVAEVENEPYKPFQQAIVTPATDYSKISVVSVLLTR